jgi:hypothetical protein
MRFILFVALLLAVFVKGSAQSSTRGPGATLNNSFDAFNVTEIKYVPKLSGSDYLYADWLLADVKLGIDSGYIENIMIKMDVTNNVIEVKLPDTIRIAPSILIESIKFKNPLRGNFTTRNGLNVVGPVGFYQVLYDNEVDFYAYYYTTVKKADYNYVLNTGSKDDIVEVKKWYYLRKGDQLFQFELRKNSLLALFENSQPLDDFMKSNKIALKSEEDLKKVGEFLNSNISALQIKPNTIAN